MANERTHRDAEVGDSVTYRSPQGQEFSGRVVIKTNTHVVINVGGRGIPKCVDDSNFVRMRKGKNRVERSELAKILFG